MGCWDIVYMGTWRRRIKRAWMSPDEIGIGGICILGTFCWIWAYTSMDETNDCGCFVGYMVMFGLLDA